MTDRAHRTEVEKWQAAGSVSEGTCWDRLFVAAFAALSAPRSYCTSSTWCKRSQ